LDIPVLAAGDGTLRAEDDGKPASAKSVQSYIARAFGDRLGEARGAMEALAESLPPEELNRVGFRLYERFRPDVPEGHRGGRRRASCGWRGLSGRRGDGPGASPWSRKSMRYSARTVHPGKAMTVKEMRPIVATQRAFSTP
jgi:hypothetical protein